MSENTGLITGPDGIERCFWHGNLPDYLHYHDHEWGRPMANDTRLFEKICLEGFQSGLSWLTILRKRENFREAFAGFEVDRVARFTDEDVERLLGNAGIIRHRGKIVSTINNADAPASWPTRRDRWRHGSGSSSRGRRSVRQWSISRISRPIRRPPFRCAFPRN